MRVRVTSGARQDILEIVDWIARENPPAAVRVRDRILHRIENLEQFPELGVVGRLPGTRELVVTRTPYFVIYQIYESTVEVLAIRHSARRWPPK